MSAVVGFIKDVVNFVIEAVEDLVVAAWDAVVEPILEQVFAIFGITDETVVTVQRVSSPIYNQNTVDVVGAGITRAILKKIQLNGEYFPNYMEQIFKTKAQIRAYFRYADLNIYYAGLPNMEIAGVAVDFAKVQQALDSTFASTHTVISAISRNPSKYNWFYWEMQDSPEFYQPWTNTLTHTDIYGATRDGWLVGVIDYNSGPDNYTINISRDMEEAEFWIQGPGQITEGDTATFTVKSNRIVPLGETIGIDFTYAGTAVDGVDYTQVASVTMLENTDEVTVDIVTAETANANRTFSITINAIDNTGGVFEWVKINGQDTVNCTITDDDTLRMNMNDVIVDEANVTITVSVTLSQTAPSGAFSVDYNFTDLGSTVGGVDYDNTTGTLNFVGTAGEVQDITIDIYADVADDDKEQFEVFLENSTDVDSIDMSIVSTVTIIDGTLDPVPATVPINDTITKPSYIPEDSLVVTYSDDAAPSVEFRYWIYPHSAGTWDLVPEDVVITDLEMLPLAILRKEKKQLDTLYGTGSNEYITTKMLMARAGLDLQEFLDAIAGNPDIGDIDDAYINYSLQPKDTNKIVSKMLYLQWYQIIVTSGLQSNIGQFNATIKEGDIENAIVWSEHTFTPGILGVVTAEGDYTHFRTGTTLTMQYQRLAGSYDQIVMKNLNGMTSIKYAGYSEVALCKLGDDEFTIPTSWDIFEKVTAQEQMEVYQFLARVDVNAINITHLEWYETQDFWDLFEFALAAIAVITFVYSFGASGSFYAGVVAIVEAFVVNWAIGELILFVAEQTGNNLLGALAGVAAAVYLNDPSLLSTDALLQADTLLDLSTEFVNNLMFVDSLETQELAKELDETNREAQERIEKELANREDVKAVAVDANFLAAIQSVDTNYFPAIQGNYSYDETYNYDSLIANYHNQQLQKGVR